MASSFIPPQGFGLPSLNQGQNVNAPKASAGSYVNQQLAGLVSGTTAKIGGSTPANLPKAAQVGADTAPESAVSAGTKQLQDSIQQGNVRLGDYAQQAAMKRQATALQAGGMGGNNFGGGMPGGPGSGGKPWAFNSNYSNQRNKALALASTYLGNPYVLGGTSHRGIDCSGLVMMVYNQLGFNITHHGATWEGQHIPGVRTAFKNLRPGDLVCWRDGSHIAIYAGNGEIIEAPNPHRGVVRRRLWTSPGNVFGIRVRFRGE